ncbi:MAG: ORF6N domain-containing protein [Bacteroidales bacterium]|nr:ORF6N domain-containing protein [Bacteroidales bacterium]
MNEIELIQNKIYEIRGQRVMLDFDLAEMYGIETKNLKRAVKRNLERFEGSGFMFELTEIELQSLRCNFGTSKRGGIRYAPFAFTELGVAMLSSVLNSPIAIQINRNIMRAFVIMRKAIASDNERIYKLEDKVEKLSNYIEEIMVDQNDINEETRAQLDAITTALAELQAKPKEEKPRRRIGFIQDDK